MTKMRALFQTLESAETWTDKYTGQTHSAAPGQRAEPQGKQQAVASSRRSLFLEGSAEKPRRPDTEEKLAELIAPLQRNPDFIKGASKFFGGNHLAEQGNNLPSIEKPLPQAPMRNVPLKTDHVQATKEIKHSGEGLKQSASLGIEGRVKARDAQPLPSTTTTRQASIQQKATHEQTKSERAFNETVTERSVHSYTPVQVQATLKLREASKARDIVLDILMSRGHAADTVASSELQDIAMKLVALPASEKTATSTTVLKQALATSTQELVDRSVVQKRAAPTAIDAFGGSAKGPQDLKVLKEPLIDYSKDRLSTDVLLAAQRAMGNLKDDAEEQLRIGTWAVHVLAGRMDSVPSELLRGMKKDAIQALGRLSMQLLTASTKAADAEFQSTQKHRVNAGRSTAREASGAAASAEHEASQRMELEEIHDVRDNATFLQKSAIKGANEFFRMEAVQGDLQALQNNISLDFTADMLVEGFIEALRHDDLDAQRELRTDILSQFQASQTSVASSKQRLDASKVSFGTVGTSAKFNGFSKEQAPLAPPRPSSELGVELKGERISEDEEREEHVLEQLLLPQQSEGGAWSLPPSSKYSQLE